MAPFKWSRSRALAQSHQAGLRLRRNRRLLRGGNRPAASPPHRPAASNAAPRVCGTERNAAWLEGPARNGAPLSVPGTDQHQKGGRRPESLRAWQRQPPPTRASESGLLPDFCFARLGSGGGSRHLHTPPPARQSPVASPSTSGSRGAQQRPRRGPSSSFLGGGGRAREGARFNGAAVAPLRGKSQGRTRGKNSKAHAQLHPTPPRPGCRSFRRRRRSFPDARPPPFRRARRRHRRTRGDHSSPARGEPEAASALRVSHHHHTRLSASGSVGFGHFVPLWPFCWLAPPGGRRAWSPLLPRTLDVGRSPLLES